MNYELCEDVMKMVGKRLALIGLHLDLAPFMTTKLAMEETSAPDKDVLILEGVNRVPHNGGWHSDWCLPDSFIYCDSLLCRGAFCKCLRNNVDFNS